jgi:hypothetical protein
MKVIDPSGSAKRPAGAADPDGIIKKPTRHIAAYIAKCIN